MSVATVMDVATGVWPGDCLVYALSEPYEGFTNVAVCVLDFPGLRGVEVFAATQLGEQSPGADGALQSLTKLEFMPHADAFAALGFTEEVTS
jgi:hypothetical protein